MKLVCFDIDGTLVTRKGIIPSGYPRFTYAIKKVFGVDPKQDPSMSFNGWVDRAITRALLDGTGVSETEFIQKWPQIPLAFIEYITMHADTDPQEYAVISDAVSLAKKLRDDDNYIVTVMTGNVKMIGQWKLENVGINTLFPNGIYSDDVDDRNALAQKIFSWGREYYHTDFAPGDITIIGDTKYDILCGQSIHAQTIAVSYPSQSIGIHGGTTLLSDLKDLHPTLCVRSLMDPAVLAYFHLHT